MNQIFGPSATVNRSRPLLKAHLPPVTFDAASLESEDVEKMN